MDELNILNSETTNSNKRSNIGLGLVGLTGFTGIGLSIVCFPFIAPAFRKHCLPYVPATINQLKNVSDCLPIHKGRLLDIGSGDGRIVIQAAKHGWQSDGVELNPFLVYYSKFSAFKHGVASKTAFFKKDLWKFSTKPYDCIVIFGVEQMMPELEVKLNQEISERTTVIACRFPFNNKKLRLIKTIDDGVDTVWVYKKQVER